MDNQSSIIKKRAYMEKYNQRPDVKERKRKWQRERYRNDPEYRERRLRQAREYRCQRQIEERLNTLYLIADMAKEMLGRDNDEI
jgi:hypothetical protein